jgi:hypothetical protein
MLARIPLVFFIITSFFQGIFLELLPYKCLISGYSSLNNLSPI